MLLLPWPMSIWTGPERVKLGALTLNATVVVAVRLPEVPVTVSVLFPTVAVLLAVSVRVLPLVVGFGENDAVTPLGSPDTERLTLPLNPKRSFTKTNVLPLLPRPMATEPPLERVKLGAWTARARVVVVVMLPEVPVMVNVDALAGAELLTVRVSTLLPDVGFVPHEAVTPVGRPVTERLTLPVNPYSGVTVIVEVPELP